MLTAFFGLPGSGKTMALVRVALQALVEGRDVYTNFPLRWHGAPPLDLGIFKRKAVPATRWHYFTGMDENFVPGSVICLDEGWLYLNSYFRSQLTMEVQSKFFQHRKDGFDIYYTSQRIGQIVAPVRDLTNFFFYCNCQDWHFVGLRKKMFFQWPVDVRGSDWKIQTMIVKEGRGDDAVSVEVPVKPRRYRFRQAEADCYDTNLKIEDGRIVMAQSEGVHYPAPLCKGHVITLPGVAFVRSPDATILVPRVTQAVRTVWVPGFDGIMPLHSHAPPTRTECA